MVRSHVVEFPQNLFHCTSARSSSSAPDQSTATSSLTGSDGIGLANGFSSAFENLERSCRDRRRNSELGRYPPDENLRCKILALDGVFAPDLKVVARR